MESPTIPSPGPMERDVHNLNHKANYLGITIESPTITEPKLAEHELAVLFRQQWPSSGPRFSYHKANVIVRPKWTSNDGEVHAWVCTRLSGSFVGVNHKHGDKYELLLLLRTAHNLQTQARNNKVEQILSSACIELEEHLSGLEEGGFSINIKVTQKHLEMVVFASAWMALWYEVKLFAFEM